MKVNWQSLVHRSFLVGVILKGCDGMLELGSGAALLLVSRPAIRHLVVVLTHGELVEDPHDFFANLLLRLSLHLSIHTKQFAAVYLLGHGLVKAGLAIGLLRRVRWSYPAAIAFLALFIGYQIVRIFTSHSIPLSMLTLADMGIVGLVWREWRYGTVREPRNSLRSDPGLDQQ